MYDYYTPTFKIFLGLLLFTIIGIIIYSIIDIVKAVGKSGHKSKTRENMKSNDLNLLY